MHEPEFPKGHLHLFLTEIGEPEENELRLMVAEGLLGEPEIIDVSVPALGEGCPIEVTANSRTFEIIWCNYVAYVVRNASFWKAEEAEPPLSDCLERRYNSAFARYVSETTFADDGYPGPLEHWSLTTLRHIVDVISVGPPSVAALKPAA